MSDVLQATRRTSFGSAATRRLRRDGYVPAVIYGHGEANEHIAVPVREVQTVLRHHSKTIKLAGDLNENALIAEMQYDALGIDVLHLDLIRVNLKELVEVTVPIHTHGQAPGTVGGGVLLESLHQVDIRCPAGAIPDRLELDVNSMEVGDQATASDLELPEGVELITDADIVIARVEIPQVAPDPEETTEVAAMEPEVIGEASDEDAEDPAE